MVDDRVIGRGGHQAVDTGTTTDRGLREVATLGVGSSSGATAAVGTRRNPVRPARSALDDQ